MLKRESKTHQVDIVHSPSLLHSFPRAWTDSNDQVTMEEEARSEGTLAELVQLTDGMSGRGLELRSRLKSLASEFRSIS